jgi:hypothetical protein
MEAVIMTMLLDGRSSGPRPGGQFWTPEETPEETPGETAAEWDDGPAAQGLLGEMAALLRDSRPGLMAGISALAAMTVGLAVEVMAFSAVSRPVAATWACAGLFTIAALCWLRATALFMLSGVPLGRTLAQLRARTGAPQDPRAPWASAPPATAGQWTWAHAHLMVSQSRFRYQRIQHAMNWTLLTGAAFLACSAALLFTR